MQRIAVFSAGLCCALLLAGCGGPSGAASARAGADIFPCRSAGGDAVPCPRAGRGGSFRGNAGRRRPPPLRLRPRRSLLPDAAPALF